MYSKKNFDIVYNTKNIAQIIPEMAEFLDRLKILKPKVIVEIGSYCCGVLACIAKVLPNSLYIAVDIGDLGPKNELARENIASILRLKILDHRDSHDSKTVEDLREILDEQEINVLIIDGDHSYQGVKQDFEMYSPLVNKNGLILIHDIKECDQYRKTGVEVWRFWNEIKSKYRTEEIKYNNPQEYGADSCGWGIIYLK